MASNRKRRPGNHQPNPPLPKDVLVFSRRYDASYVTLASPMRSFSTTHILTSPRGTSLSKEARCILLHPHLTKETWHIQPLLLPPQEHLIIGISEASPKAHFFKGISWEHLFKNISSGTSSREHLLRITFPKPKHI